jgi:hypothetical protein
MDNYICYLADLYRLYNVAKYSKKNACMIDINGSHRRNIAKFWMRGDLSFVPFGNMGIINNIYWYHIRTNSIAVRNETDNKIVSFHDRDRYIRYIQNNVNKKAEYIIFLFQKFTDIPMDICIILAKKYIMNEIYENIMAYENEIKTFI